MLFRSSRFIVKGVSGEFTPVGKRGPSYDWSLEPALLNLDISLIAGMGANAIRSYNQEPTQVQALDMLHDKELYMIMGFPVDVVYGNGQVVDFSNPVVRQNIKTRFLQMVAHWKDHPAILMWCLGNEVNKALEEHGVWPGHWYSLVEECAQAAHALEGENDHPVTTANADQAVWDIGDPAKNANDASLPHLDIWSLQLYRGPSFGSAFTDYKNSSAKPLLISEFGCDAYNGLTNQEDEAMQAFYLSTLWKDIARHLAHPIFSHPSHACIGGVLFAWRDGWWKSQNGTELTHDTSTDWLNPNYKDPNMNEEWFGVVKISEGIPAMLTPRQGYYLWTNTERDLAPTPMNTGLFQRNKR